MANKYRRILVPTDFSESSRSALDAAIGLLESGSILHVCHVVDDVPLSYGYIGTAAMGPDVRTRMSKEAARELESFSLDELPVGAEIHRTVVHGAPYAAILKFAKEIDADLIVMATHGRTGIKHALIGSVAERVVRKAPCPVLVVRPAAMAE